MFKSSTGEIWVLLATVASWSIDGVVQPFCIVPGGLAKSVLLMGDCSVKPFAIRLTWGHVAVIVAVETVVGRGL
jgi:hypothetical protein